MGALQATVHQHLIGENTDEFAAWQFGHFEDDPVNAVLMGAFMLVSSYHMELGLREVVEDYVHTNGIKLFLMLLIRAFASAVAIAAAVALLRITIA